MNKFRVWINVHNYGRAIEPYIRSMRETQQRTNLEKEEMPDSFAETVLCRHQAARQISPTRTCIIIHVYRLDTAVVCLIFSHFVPVVSRQLFLSNLKIRR